MPNDLEMEKEITDLKLIAPRITPDRIEELMEGVTYHVSQPSGTTSTIVTSFDVNGFSLCTEIMACASAENFNAELGVKYGIEKCKNSSRDMLWKLEGYRLKCHLAEMENLK